MKECRYAKQYKARHAPKCNDGDPCDMCKDKWDAELRLRRIESSVARLDMRKDPHGD